MFPGNPCLDKQSQTCNAAPGGGDLISAPADYSAKTDLYKAHPRISCLEGDLVARAVVDNLLKLRPDFWRDPTLQSVAGHVLLASSEPPLAKNWGNLRHGAVRIIALSDECYKDPLLDAAVFAYLPPSTPIPLVGRMIENALCDIRRDDLHHQSAERLRIASVEIDGLNRIGVALSAEHKIPKLLEMILTRARQMTLADAGSIYFVEAAPDDFWSGSPERHSAITGSIQELEIDWRKPDVTSRPVALRFMWAQNDTVSVPFEQTTVEISNASIAGYVALTGQSVQLDDAYDPPPGLPYSINHDFDQKLGYRTKSILAVPMCNEKDEVVGVLQLINSKRDPSAKLTSRSGVAAQVVPFTLHHRKLLLSLASQAAVALQNSRLLASIENLFEGFVRAAVVAIEERDPTTCGHSARVARLTLALAEAVNRTTTGPLANIRFTPTQKKELRYAALLHDFGKVGVREDVLLKKEKLYPAQLEQLRHRFLFAKRTAETELLRAKLELLLAPGEHAYSQGAQQADLRFQKYCTELDALWDWVLQCNVPSATSQTVFARLAEAGARTYADLDGIPQALISNEEIRLLSIPQGSLDPLERTQMEAHVAYTVRFLSQIPWTTEVRGVIPIAGAHHEKLNGSGYPHGLSAADIPVQTRMLTIVDIFDGITASDRPYKKAFTAQEALGILRVEVAAGAIDPDLFELFADLVRRGIHKAESQQPDSASSDKQEVA
jgi:HD-GYP domain-containing protein (c-di-GMP phosphodiesterase class II)